MLVFQLSSKKTRRKVPLFTFPFKQQSYQSMLVSEVHGNLFQVCNAPLQFVRQFLWLRHLSATQESQFDPLWLLCKYLVMKSSLKTTSNHAKLMTIFSFLSFFQDGNRYRNSKVTDRKNMRYKQEYLLPNGLVIVNYLHLIRQKYHFGKKEDRGGFFSIVNLKTHDDRNTLKGQEK